jgi:hypothetical protein
LNTRGNLHCTGLDGLHNIFTQFEGNLLDLYWNLVEVTADLNWGYRGHPCFLWAIAGTESWVQSRSPLSFFLLLHFLLVYFGGTLPVTLAQWSKAWTDGRAIAQAVSRRLPTAAVRVQTRVWSCGILWWTKRALGQVFSENFGFPCQYTFHQLLYNHLHYHPRLAQ